MLRRLFLVFMAFWLPVQAGAALAASLTMDVAQQPVHEQAHATTAQDQAGTHAHAPPDATDSGHDGHTGHAGHADHDNSVAGSCDLCGLCHFAHGGVMPNPGASLPAVALQPVFALLGDERFTGHIPELLQRPPLPSA